MAECEEKKAIMASIKAIHDIVEDEKMERRKNTKDIQELKQEGSANDQKFERIFESFEELKRAVADISIILKERNERLPNFLYGVIGTILGGGGGALLFWLVTK